MKYKKESDGLSVAIATGVSFVFIGVPVSLASLTWLQIWIAPKVYLLEYAANLIK